VPFLLSCDVADLMRPWWRCAVVAGNGRIRRQSVRHSIDSYGARPKIRCQWRARRRRILCLSVVSGSPFPSRPPPA